MNTIMSSFAHLLPSSLRPAPRGTAAQRAAAAEDDTEEEMEEGEDEAQDEAGDETEEEAESEEEAEEAAASAAAPAARPSASPSASPSAGQRSAAEKTAIRQGRQAERARWKGVLGNKASGHGRILAAISLLAGTDLSETQIVAQLKAMPKQATGSRLDTAMSGIRQPEIGAGSGDDDRPKNGARTALSASVQSHVKKMTDRRAR